MQTEPQKRTHNRGCIYTLAQTGTALKPKQKVKPVKTVKGNGTDATQIEVLQNRAKRKTITQAVCRKLVDVAKRKGEPERAKAYWNAWHCQTRVTSANGRFYGNYCRNRFCTLCSSIRKAEIINKYFPLIKTWAQPYFVTLTAKAVPACKLKSRFERMFLSIRKLLSRNKKRAQRGTGIKLKGIKSIECNFNPVKRTYNPHFHLIVETKEMAELIIKEWLEQCTPAYAIRSAQHYRSVEDTTKDLIEIIKYGSKIFTDPTMKKKAQRKVSPYIYASAFDNIIAAMKGHRVFDRFGFNLPKNEKTKGGKRTYLTDYTELIFDPSQFDWVNPGTAEILTGYIPEPQLIEILQNNIDTEAQ